MHLPGLKMSTSKQMRGMFLGYIKQEKNNSYHHHEYAQFMSDEKCCCIFFPVLLER